MKTTIISILFSIATIIVAVSANAQDWRLTKNKNGISVYEARSENSNFKNIKVVCTLEGNYDKLLKIIADVSHHKDWVYHNKEAALLKTVSPLEFYYYTETTLPWPATNRDVVVHTIITRDSKNQFLKIHSANHDGMVKEKPGKVRVEHSNINWYVTAPTAKTISIVYTMEANPGGSIPAWLVNSFADKGPYESFIKLEELLKK